jgi:hypothetical protein
MSVQSAQITVGTAATLLSAAETDTPAGARLVVRNSSATTSVFLGGAGVTASTGLELPSATQLPWTLDLGEALYAAVVVGTVVVHVLQGGV